MSIFIGADIVPTQSNMQLFENAEAIALIGKELLGELSVAEKVILNLETPLVDNCSPIKKSGPSLSASTKSANLLREIGVDIVTLANNHIMDQDVPGLESTIKTIKDLGIDYIGVGDTLSTIKKSIVFDYKNNKVGIYACAETEFSIAGENRAGANPFDSLETPDEICALKERCDYVIVLYHGGKEHYRYPSPKLQKRCRKMIEKGADLVICQHSHCIGCEEKYKGATIVYGQGNFLFNMTNDEMWKTGLLIKLDDQFTISYIPIVKTEKGVKLAEKMNAEEILREFEERSEQIKNADFICNKYNEMSAASYEYYRSCLNGKRGLVFKLINKLSGYKFGKWWLNRKYGPNEIRCIRNIIECEAHRELLLKWTHQF